MQQTAKTPNPAEKPATVLAVVGPTAVGKTALAEQIAIRVGGEIVSADSMQVYCGMDIGTAKPAASERLVPYHCIDLVEPGAEYSAALFQRDARAAIGDVSERGLVPVVAGGTGLYVRAALDAMEFPAGEQRENPKRAAYERVAAEEGADALHGLLEQRDPAAAVLIHANNVRRVVRALEMLDEGTSYADQHAGFAVRESIFDTRFVGLEMERSRLYARIDQRVDEMVAQGLLGEVEGLLARGFREALTATQAIGYKELVPVIENDVPLDGAVEDIKRASRRYAKRQLTWFRADPRIVWLDVTDMSSGELLEAALAALDCS